MTSRTNYFNLFLLILLYAGLTELGIPFWATIIIAVVIGLAT